MSMTALDVAQSHDVTVDRLERIPDECLDLLDEALTRLVASGWRARRIAQVKMKFGTLRLYVYQEGESAEFLRWATMVTSEVEERSRET